MDIRILPYIDKTQMTQMTQAQGGMQGAAGAKNADFEAALSAAEGAITEIAENLVADGDADRIREAAAILSASGAPKLQQMGQALSQSARAIENGGLMQSIQLSSATGGSAAAESGQVSATAKTEQAKAAAEQAGAAEETAGKASAEASPLTHTSDPAYVSDLLDCPDALRPYFEEASETYGVDVAFLEAIAKTESNFRADAVSSAGATGVMQLMPSTAEGLGVKDATDAKENIMGGAKLIASLLEKYDGDTSLALAAYNAGSGNVAKYGGIPPFAETQSYVKKVEKYYAEALG